ncbi:MAG: hypothetical protein KIT20_02645 [Alphaproteobacteria bacterium]|nr:hypothetical protein [Alphaproteobacteria bacterium]
MRNLLASPLRHEQIDAAWALIRICGNVRGSLAEWRAYAKSRLPSASRGPGRQGLVAIHCTRGYIYGLFAYNAETDPVHRMVLTVEPLAFARLAHSLDPGEVLLAASEDLARTLDCRAIHLVLSADDGDGSGLRRIGRDCGYRLTAERLCKELPDVEAGRSIN